MMIAPPIARSTDCQSAWSLCGVRIAIAAPTEARLRAIEELLPASREAIAVADAAMRFEVVPVLRDGERRFEVREGGELVRDFGSFRLARDCVRSRVELFTAENCTKFAFLHAGVVGIDGSAVLIPGESCWGKTTLVARLVEAGATYLSDEYALLDQEGRVHPWPRSLGVRTGGRKEYVPPNELGAVAQESWPVGLVLVTRYRPNHRWRPRRISPARATLTLLDNALPAQQRPAWTLAAIGAAVRHAVCLTGDRGNASQVVEQLVPNFPPNGRGVSCSPLHAATTWLSKS